MPSSWLLKYFYDHSLYYIYIYYTICIYYTIHTFKFKLVSRGCKRAQVHQLLANCKIYLLSHSLWDLSDTTEDKRLVRCWRQRLLRETVWRRAEGWQMKGGQGWREIWEWRCPTSWWMCFNPADKISSPWKEKFRHTIFRRGIWVLSYFLRECLLAARR